jgi:hypothetical protein
MNGIFHLAHMHIHANEATSGLFIGMQYPKEKSNTSVDK